MREPAWNDGPQRHPDTRPAAPETVGSGGGAHELVRAYAALGAPLHPTLAEMLNEHHSHQTERRGCGYTQATRFLADLVNRDPTQACGAGTLFDRAADAERIAAAVEQLAGQWQRIESELLSALIADLVDPARPARASHSELPLAPEKLKVGSCPLAEQYFLEIAHGRVRRGGRVHVVVDAHGQACLLEKRGLGDEHSCISVRALWFNGVRIPRGSLWAVAYEDAVLDELPALRGLPGRRLPAERLQGARLLRLTTLAIEPAFRARAFSAHFKQQVDGGLFSPDSTRIEQLAAIAEDSLP